MDLKIIQQAKEILDRCAVITLASIDHGYPCPIPISKIGADGVNTLWFATALNSVKTNNFWENPAAGVSFFEGRNSVTLRGRVSVVMDRGITAKLWHEPFNDHFAKGVNDPEYVILKFTSQRVVCWIDSKFETLDL